jgi:drug/metabolite transporter (DMT)-like permease
MTWQLFTAVSVVALSISIILQRILIHKDKVNPFGYAVVFQGMVAVVISVFLLLHGFSLPNMDKFWMPAIASMLLYGAGHIVYAKTLQRVEASVFSVFFATQAVWIMLLGVFWFNESLTWLQIVGSALIFGSIILLVKWQSLRTLDRGLVLGLLTGLLFGFAITCWSYVGRHTDTLSWAAVSFVGTSLSALLFYPKSVAYMRPLFRGAILSRMMLLSVFYAVGCVAMLYAYKLGTFTIVSPLRQTGIILTVLMALVFLKSERTQIARKVAAAAVCTLGVILIVAK